MRNSSISKLLTPGRIADELGVPLPRVLYVLATRRHISPVARAGTLRLYSRKAVAMVRHELNAIAARKAGKRFSQLATGHFGSNNHKLGNGIFSWEMTPIAACPGCKHALCAELRPYGKGPSLPMCFGCRGRYRMFRMRQYMEENFQFAQSDRFVPWVNDFLAHRRHIRAVRMPGVGDLFSTDFIGKVGAVVMANPKIKFWCYTRVWCVPKLWAEVQRKLKGLPNMTIWCSIDRKMHARYGTPDGDLPWCWLAETDDDVPPMRVDLVWRYDSFSYSKYVSPVKLTIGGCVVCPHEDGVTTTTCSKCGICLARKRVPRGDDRQSAEKVAIIGRSKGGLVGRNNAPGEARLCQPL